MGLAQNERTGLLVDAVSAVCGRLGINQRSFFCQGGRLSWALMLFIERRIVSSPARRHNLLQVRWRIPHTSGWSKIGELFSGANLLENEQPDQNEDQRYSDAVGPKERRQPIFRRRRTRALRQHAASGAQEQ